MQRIISLQQSGAAAASKWHNQLSGDGGKWRQAAEAAAIGGEIWRQTSDK
jgi:hypothetical protein